MNENLKDQDVLLVREKGSNELRTAQMGKDGKVKTAKPDGENPDFLKIDKHGNILENFFANFMRQVKEPTRFEFFCVPADKFGEVMQKLQEAFKHPDKPENRTLMPDGEALMDNTDLCRMLNVSKRTLQRYRSLGELPFTMIYHKTYYKESDVVKFVEKHFSKFRKMKDKKK